MYKYEGVPYDGSITGSATGNSPAATSSGSTWASTAAVCHEETTRLGTVSSNCGNTNVSNRLKSVSGLSPANTTYSFGVYYRACRNSTASDGDGNTLRFYLPSGMEWTAASDWGDINYDTVLDDNAFASASVTTLETSTGAAYCGAAGSPAVTGNKSSCRSRYGAYDMVGNVSEHTADRLYNFLGLDNGMDGIGLGTVSVEAASVTYRPTRYDIWRGIPTLTSFSGGVTGLTLPSVFYYGSQANGAPGLYATTRGGHYGTGTSTSRWYMDYGNTVTDVHAVMGGRCGF